MLYSIFYLNLCDSTLVYQLIMQEEFTEIFVRGVLHSINGYAIFLGNDEKNFVIYVEPSVGKAISKTISEKKSERPMTHDLIQHIFLGIGIQLERVIIADVNKNTFFARIILKMENELGTKLVELDTRPSDAIVLALQEKQQILVTRKVIDSVEDMTEVLEQILKQ